MENFDQTTRLMSFNKVFKMIEENQKQKKQSVDNMIMFIINMIEELQKDLMELKSKAVIQLDQLIRNVDEWIGNVKLVGQQQVTYSFYDQLDKLINQNILEELNQKSLIDKMNQIQQSYNQKIQMNLNSFKQFQKCEEILKKLRNINETRENIKEQIQSEKQVQKIQVDNEQQQQFETQLMKCKQVEFKLIDSNKQSGQCFAIVFNVEGSIMVSTEEKTIKIWNFQQGRLKLIDSYNKHTASINYKQLYFRQRQTRNYLLAINQCKQVEVLVTKKIAQFQC
ncbi:unnamed protein product (macronuclear) [Paramecium tetraurelia]|uniref:Anaphase-promoting complex subunit 4 WD40 domain-containing protein n=1 Tax=Paramecium tetraurelia TaxID=5888 RepID=A0DBT7_PARTE|nr:uncharacterized protein GSPATT00039400001 [Paramecium tetraurelia]CAK80504.1 unnamed protein product [Paramecium tetraurelia]|eukprot:XP_001447901.1 hypothetical protein (macronuclear) [Paramecium tetraurelia strain d4-2]